MTLWHNNRAIAIREASGSGSVYMGGAHPTVWGESDLLTVYVWNQRRISAGRNLSQMSSDRQSSIAAGWGASNRVDPAVGIRSIRCRNLKLF